MGNFVPKRAGETKLYMVDFADDLLPGETITSAVWTVTVASTGNIDPNPNAMVQGSASPNGSQVIQMLTGGVPGVRYAPICTAQTSLGETLIRPKTYGDGLLEVTL